MPISDLLRELVDQHSPRIYDDPAAFAGLLDDVLSESDATPGQANLLVDAVRFGAVPRLARAAGTGAEPERVVDEVAGRVAELRGGSDLVAARWATAVLGHSIRALPPDLAAELIAGRRAPAGGEGRSAADVFPVASDRPIPSAPAAPTMVPSAAVPATDRFWLWAWIIIVMSGVLGALVVALYLQR